MKLPTRVLRIIHKWARGVFCVLSLIALLAILTAVPMLQLIAFGYLLGVAGRLAGGADFRDSLPGLTQAGQIGLAAMVLFIVALPTRLIAHWESVAVLIQPGSDPAGVMRFLAIVASVAAMVYLLIALALGGHLADYAWPVSFCFCPKRYSRRLFSKKVWSALPNRLWEFTVSLDLLSHFWLGLRGAIGTMVWLIPALVIMLTFREGDSGAAGFLGIVALLVLGISMMYLPMLQAHFADANRVSALFDVRRIRADFRGAPWSWLAAMLLMLLVLPLPLYLLKIEATQQEVMWLPCFVFVAFMLPARIATGLALRRCRRNLQSADVSSAVSQWIVRSLMPLVVAIYLGFVYLSQYTSWDGLGTWIAQHAVLIPVPFVDGT